MLRDAFFDIRAYDIVLFDAAPAKSRFTRGAILASGFDGKVLDKGVVLLVERFDRNAGASRTQS